MKTTLLAISFALFLTPFAILAQSPALVAKFGIDGELSNDTLKLGSGTPSGSHDWFKQKAGTGIGLIDTTGTSIYGPQILGGANLIFDKGQSVSRFSVVDNMYMLDTRYGRDGVGASTQDPTVFNSPNKNGMSPMTWTFLTNGGTVQNKNDIVDVYAHMRRNGTIINSTNPSPLYLMAGASTLGTEGDRNIDFELFKSRISFSPLTGFSNSGPATTGGHSVWTFNPDGTVSSTGDMLVSFSYSSTSVNDIAVFIWVAATIKDNVNPLYFDFIPGEYFGGSANATYGYCKITQNNGLPNFEFSATTNTFTSKGPFWGTNSKDLGAIGTNYSSSNYSSGQFSEVAINLTSLGIDPALGNAASTTDPCAPPFSRIIIKTRSSNSSTSDLKDFTGPYPFLDAPQVPQQIAPANLTCTNNTTTLRPLYPQAGAFYVWSTVGGNIMSNPISESITVSGEGKYYLTASVVNGCLGVSDSIILTRDSYQPVATASTVGWMNHVDPTLMATLVGGDDSASNYMTPFGMSLGLTWEWSGPAGYTANTKNATTNFEGNFMLIVTELRNGCKDTAYTPVYSSQTLPVTLVSFKANLNNSKVDLTWTTEAEINFNHFEVERSFDAFEFRNIATVFAAGNVNTKMNYKYADNITDINRNLIYYRLKMVDKDGSFKYSEVRVIRISKQSESLNILTYPNPVANEVRVTIPNTWQNKELKYQIFNSNGQLVMTKINTNASQTEIFNINNLTQGFYILFVKNGEESAQQKIIKN